MTLQRTRRRPPGSRRRSSSPDGQRNGRVLYCLPGGGMSRRYFDLDAPGYSMAEHLAAQGFVVVTIDHPGVGDSPPPDDPWTLTPHVVADADAAAVAELDRQLGGIPIGVGHSMGGMLTVTVQARHRPYAGLGLLGYAHSDHYELTALAAYLSDEEKAIVGNQDAHRRPAGRSGERALRPPAAQGQHGAFGLPARRDARARRGARRDGPVRVATCSRSAGSARCSNAPRRT